MSLSYLIVGAGWAGKEIAQVLLERDPNSVIGFLDDRVSGPVLLEACAKEFKIPVLGHSGHLLKLALKHHVHSVVIAVTHDREDHLLSEIVKCHERGVRVVEMPDLYERLTGKIPVRHVRQHWMLPTLSAPMDGGYMFFQNVVNYFICLVGFLCILPFFPIIALAIKCDSPGPVFFIHSRIGKRARPFPVIKFRTMVENAHLQGDAWTTQNDARITRVGKWLRKFRFDELPQLINVLKGDMALIGPRPESAELVQLFKKEIPFYEYRYLVLPGITGWAQVNHGNTSSVEGALEKLQYDLYWIKNRSFMLDMKIIFRSVKVMLTGFGAV